MFCTKCGSQLADDAAFCTKCGANVVGAETTVQQEAVMTEQSAAMATPNPTTRQPSGSPIPAVDADGVKKKKSRKLIVSLAVLVGVAIIASVVFALNRSDQSPEMNNAVSNTDDSGITYFVGVDKSLSEEYQPAVTLYRDSRFSFCANMGESMGFYNGTYSVNGDIYMFNVTEAEFYGNKDNHEDKFIMRRDNDTLTYESEDSLGLTSKGSVFSLSTMPPQSIAATRNLMGVYEGEDADDDDPGDEENLASINDIDDTALSAEELEIIASKSDAAYNAGDYTTAINLLLKAAEAGSDKSQYNLGFLYMEGKGVPQDYRQAAEWFRKAADQGHPNAQNALGFLYTEGQGVPQDYQQAAKWLSKAAEQGHPNAQNVLGALYENGAGVPKDKARAIELYKSAARQGNENARANLARLGVRY